MAAKKPQSNRESEEPMRPSDPRLPGKVAVITGGNRGIGYAVARTLAAEGCNVVITGRDRASLEQSAASIRELAGSHGSPAQVVPMVCDVRNPESVSSLFGVVQRIVRQDRRTGEQCRH